MNPEVAEQFAPALAIAAIFAAAAFAFWVNARRRETQARLRIELHNRVLDKFGSASEFAAFLQTEEGKRFVQYSAKESAARLRTILPAVQLGVILAVFGLGFFPLAFLTGRPGEVEEKVLIPGLLFLFGGAGFLVSGLVAHSLAKKWGLLKSE